MKAGTPLDRARSALLLPAIAKILFPGWEHGAPRTPDQATKGSPPAGVYLRKVGHEWVWYNQHTGDQGDEIDFIAKARGCNRLEAAQWLIEAARTYVPRPWMDPKAQTSTKPGKRGAK
jgi:hypothetical protein